MTPGPERSTGLGTCVSPADLPELLPSRPLLSSGDRWAGLVVQRYRHPPGHIEGHAMRDHCVVAYVGSPLLVEERLERGGPQRRWTDRGFISLIPAGQPVNRTLRGRADVVVIHVAATLLDAVVEEVYDRDPARVAMIRSLPEPDFRLSRLAGILLDEVSVEAPGTGLMAESLGRAFALEMLRVHSNLSSPRAEPPFTIASGRMRRVIAQMREHFGQPLPLAELASLAGVSPSKFAQAFRETVGEPPHRHLIGIRIERSRELLEKTELSIIEIALRCGFGNPTHYATMFKKVTGFSPRSWRATRRSDPTGGIGSEKRSRSSPTARR